MTNGTAESPTYEYIELKDAMHTWQRCIKRLFDILLSGLGMILFSPLYLYIYLRLIKEEGTPVIYKQERVGYKEHTFYIYKFRTLQIDNEEEGPRLASEEEGISPFCKRLRDHHLDELPQLWNVLKGDMSMVGPRPERKFFIDQITKQDSRYPALYKMRPGVTSEATLYNGYTDTMDKMLARLRMDLNYLTHRTLHGDFIIILKTATSLFFGKKF